MKECQPVAESTGCAHTELGPWLLSNPNTAATLQGRGLNQLQLAIPGP